MPRLGLGAWQTSDDEAEPPPVPNQIELHPDFQQHELRQFCDNHNIAVELWSSIGGACTEPYVAKNAMLIEP